MQMNGYNSSLTVLHRLDMRGENLLFCSRRMQESIVKQNLTKPYA